MLLLPLVCVVARLKVCSDGNNVIAGKWQKSFARQMAKVICTANGKSHLHGKWQKSFARQMAKVICHVYEMNESAVIKSAFKSQEWA